MVEYNFNKSEVSLNNLTKEINNNSNITTELSYMIWNEPDDLCIFFNSELTSGEESELNNIMITHNSVEDTRTKIDILNQIFMTTDNTGEAPTQRDRFMNILNTKPIFMIAVESAISTSDWSFARGLVTEDTELLQDDKDLILSILPE